MGKVEIKQNVYWIGVNDRTTDLFEGLWPVSQEGVSYNSYFINDEKKAIIDLAKDIKTDDLINHIGEICEISQIDYLIMNHLEPDHTGALCTFRKMAPNVQIICTPKAKEMLASFYGITENVRVVADGETISLGKRELTFYHVPFVHWPETMVTYEGSDKILFACDAFGGYGALRGSIFDDECRDIDFYIKESLRYYSNIVAKFSTPVLNAIKKLGPLEIKIIAPSHGLIWRKEPWRIVELYKKWADFATNGGEQGVTLLYGSMYGNTENMMERIAQGIADEGVLVDIFDVARVHPSYILPSLWAKNGVIIGAPTYEVSLFPYMAQVLEEAAMKNVKNKKAAYFGSYGWSKGALKKTESIVTPLNWEMTDSFEFVGAPTEDDLKHGYEFGRKFAKLIKESK